MRKRKHDYSKIDFENKTLREIELETGISYDTLICHCKQNGVKFKRDKTRHPKYDYSKIDFENKTLREISEETGVKIKTLSRYCLAHNINFKHSKPGPSKYDYSKIDFENKTLRKIEEETGISYTTLICYCKKNNIKFKRGYGSRKPGPSKYDYSKIDFENKSLPEISKETGIPYNTLRQHCWLNKIEYKYRKPENSKTNYIVGGKIMEKIIRETFGRVDGKKFIDEIATYEYEDNYSNCTVYAVLKQRDGNYSIVTQTLTDNSDPEAEWPKAIVVAKDIVDESEAIVKCKEMFRLD